MQRTWTADLIKDVITGKNELQNERHEYLFCNDLWKNIKSYVFPSQDVQRGINRMSMIMNRNPYTAYDIKCGIEYKIFKKTAPRGSKALLKILNNLSSNYYPINLETGESLIDGLNIKLYKDYEKFAKNHWKQERNNTIKQLINRVKPFHSSTGEWCGYSDGKIIYLDETDFWRRYHKKPILKTRQEKIIAYEKTIKHNLIWEAINSWNLKHPKCIGCGNNDGIIVTADSTCLCEECFT